MLDPKLQRDLARLSQAPRSAFTHSLRRQLDARGIELGMAPQTFHPLLWLMRTGSVAFGVAIVVTGAYAYESPSVNRTSPLFLIKRLGESMEIAFATDQQQLVDVYLKIASRRVAESERLAEDGVVDAPTIAEVTANTEQALAAATSLSVPRDRAAAQRRVATASSKTATTLRTVSITAQVAANKPVIVVNEDLVALAPPPSTSLPTQVAVVASRPREDAVAGNSAGVPQEETRFAISPSAPEDPSIRAIDAAITASTALAVAGGVPVEPSGAQPPPSIPVPSSAPAVPPAPVSATPPSSIPSTPQGVSSAPVSSAPESSTPPASSQPVSSPAPSPSSAL